MPVIKLSRLTVPPPAHSVAVVELPALAASFSKMVATELLAAQGACPATV